jgi:hypothetical protein
MAPLRQTCLHPPTHPHIHTHTHIHTCRDRHTYTHSRIHQHTRRGRVVERQRSETYRGRPAHMCEYTTAQTQGHARPHTHTHTHTHIVFKHTLTSGFTQPQALTHLPTCRRAQTVYAGMDPLQTRLRIHGTDRTGLQKGKQSLQLQHTRPISATNIPAKEVPWVQALPWAVPGRLAAGVHWHERGLVSRLRRQGQGTVPQGPPTQSLNTTSWERNVQEARRCMA